MWWWKCSQKRWVRIFNNENNINDSCSNTCEEEEGWFCTGGGINSEDECNEICGDGINHGNHECDDGNLNDGDG